VLEEDPDIAHTLTAHHGRNSGEDVYVIDDVPARCIAASTQTKGSPNDSTFVVDNDVAHTIKTQERRATPESTMVVTPIQCAERGGLRKQNGLGVGVPGDPMYTMTTRADHAVFSFDEVQITNPDNRSTVRPDAPSPTISATLRIRTFSITPLGGQGSDLSAPEVDIASGLHATALGASTERGVRVQQAGSVRRLTPREVERCFGFQDDYTLIPDAADSPRYEALGNSMAVPVMRWIGRRLLMVDRIVRGK
jgi:site-specific DNA-cytosine methylase